MVKFVLCSQVIEVKVKDFTCRDAFQRQKLLPKSMLHICTFLSLMMSLFLSSHAKGFHKYFDHYETWGPPLLQCRVVSSLQHLHFVSRIISVLKTHEKCPPCGAVECGLSHKGHLWSRSTPQNWLQCEIITRWSLLQSCILALGWKWNDPTCM